MVRKACLVVAVGLAVCAGLLVAIGSPVAYAGVTQVCDGPIVRAEGDAAPPTRGSNPVERALAEECERRDHAHLVLAGLAALLGLVAGAVALTPDPSNGGHSEVYALVG